MPRITVIHLTVTQPATWRQKWQGWHGKRLQLTSLQTCQWHQTPGGSPTYSGPAPGIIASNLLACQKKKSRELLFHSLVSSCLDFLVCNKAAYRTFTRSLAWPSSNWWKTAQLGSPVGILRTFLLNSIHIWPKERRGGERECLGKFWNCKTKS